MYIAAAVLKIYTTVQNAAVKIKVLLTYRNMHQIRINIKKRRGSAIVSEEIASNNYVINHT